MERADHHEYARAHADDHQHHLNGRHRAVNNGEVSSGYGLSLPVQPGCGHAIHACHSEATTHQYIAEPQYVAQFASEPHRQNRQLALDSASIYQPSPLIASFPHHAIGQHLFGFAPEVHLFSSNALKHSNQPNDGASMEKAPSSVNVANIHSRSKANEVIPKKTSNSQLAHHRRLHRAHRDGCRNPSTDFHKPGNAGANANASVIRIRLVKHFASSWPINLSIQ